MRHTYYCMTINYAYITEYSLDGCTIYSLFNNGHHSISEQSDLISWPDYTLQRMLVVYNTLQSDIYLHWYEVNGLSIFQNMQPWKSLKLLYHYTEQFCLFRYIAHYHPHNPVHDLEKKIQHALIQEIKTDIPLKFKLVFEKKFPLLN